MGAWLGTKIGPGLMKQADAARRLNVSQSMVSRWLRGEAVPEPESCRKLARLFGESEQAVLAMAGHMSEAPPSGRPASRDDLLDRLLAVDAIEVPVHEVSASATPHRELFSGEPADFRYLPARRNYRRGRVRAIKVVGDCLEPLLHDGDEVFVDTQAEAAAGDVVAAVVGEALHIKELQPLGDGWQLEPENDDPPIPVVEGVHLLGIVLGVWTELELLRRLRRHRSHR